MPIAVQCDKCEGQFRAPDSAAGKTTACPKCGSRITIPQADTSNRLLYVFVSLAVLAVITAVGFSLLPDVAPTPQEAKPAPLGPAPFQYKILSEEWHDAFVGKAVTVEAQVPDDVAPKVTKEDLESLVPVFMEKYNGQTFKVLFYTETPLVQAWGLINHIPYTTVGEKVECSIRDFAFEFGPWYFPDRIDLNTEWHQLVWLTLPVVNKIVNGATQFEWEVTSRSANTVYFESKSAAPGQLKDTMYLSPQTWDITTHDGDVPRFVRLVESSLGYFDFEFAEQIIGKLNSVIGSQEYLSGDKTFWEWKVDRLEVTYHHFRESDSITLVQTKQ